MADGNVGGAVALLELAGRVFSRPGIGGRWATFVASGDGDIVGLKGENMLLFEPPVAFVRDAGEPPSDGE